MNIGILLAAGKNERFNGKDKLFCLINGKPVIHHSLKFLHDSKNINSILIVANKNNKKRIKALVQNVKFKKVKSVLLGGPTRYSSVVNALKKIPQNAKFLAIHNAANPLATQAELDACFEKFKTGICGIAVGRKINSTVKMLKNKAESEVDYTVPRANLREMETPQVVLAKDFIEACVKFPPPRFDYTDDLAVLEQDKKQVLVIGASGSNKKITTVQDLEMAKFISGDAARSVGIGEDSHQFEIETRAMQSAKSCLILGGIKIKNLPKLKANSDGDVIIHALCNAISSALGQGSLGTYATKRCKAGIKNSAKYLAYIMQKAVKSNKTVLHCAISIEAARPNIDKIALRMKKNLGVLLNCPEKHIGITAHSGEKLTPFGRGEAIRCQAVVLLGAL